MEGFRAVRKAVQGLNDIVDDLKMITPSAFLLLQLPLFGNLNASSELEEQLPPSVSCCEASCKFPTMFNHKVKHQVEAASLVCVCFIDAKMLRVAYLGTCESSMILNI